MQDQRLVCPGGFVVSIAHRPRAGRGAGTDRVQHARAAGERACHLGPGSAVPVHDQGQECAQVTVVIPHRPGIRRGNGRYALEEIGGSTGVRAGLDRPRLAVPVLNQRFVTPAADLSPHGPGSAASGERNAAQKVGPRPYGGRRLPCLARGGRGCRGCRTDQRASQSRRRQHPERQPGPSKSTHSRPLCQSVAQMPERCPKLPTRLGRRIDRIGLRQSSHFRSHVLRSQAERPAAGAR